MYLSLTYRQFQRYNGNLRIYEEFYNKWPSLKSEVEANEKLMKIKKKSDEENLIAQQDAQ